MASSNEPIVHEVFEPKTSTWQYVVADPDTKAAVIIDSVLDFDPVKNQISTENADALLSLIKEKGYRVEKLLETHAHADHLTASRYLQTRLAEAGEKPLVGIGKRIGVVQERFAPKYGVDLKECEGVFDKLFDDDEEFALGSLKAQVMHLPGHTPDHVGYKIGANVFCGDSLFNHDVGSARCDFPGGSATELFASVGRLLALPDDTRIWTGHDYPPNGSDGGRNEPLSHTTVALQKRENKHLKEGTLEADFVEWRRGRDATLGEPRLLHQSLQFNIRAGRLPAPSGSGGDRLLHLPLKVSGSAASF